MNGRVERIRDVLDEGDIGVEYTVEGHTCRDIAFDILQTARNDAADLILMGHPEDQLGVAHEVEYNTPCDVLFAHGFEESTDVSTVNIGAGGGPHHQASLSLANETGKGGSDLHVINVTPSGEGGTAEDPEETLAGLTDSASVEVHDVTADSVAEGLVSTATENGGMLLIGATRTRNLKRWVFGSTPDRVIERAERAGIPVIVYASETSLPQRIGDSFFPLYRYYYKLRRQRHPAMEGSASD